MTPEARELAAAREMLRSMEAQLITLYEEKAGMADLQATIDSLDAQVCALLDEKAELAAQLAALTPAVAHAA